MIIVSFLDKIWVDYLKDIYKSGSIHEKDDSEVREYLGVHKKIPNPLYTITSMTSILRDSDLFLKCVKEGKFNIEGYPIKDEALYEYVTVWDKEDMIMCGNFVYTYPERLLNNNYAIYKENQYLTILNRLRNNLGSNRAVAVLYNPLLDSDSDDIPCLNWLQCTVRDNKLVLHCVFRSNDIYGAWPSNMLLLSYLGLKLANDLGNNIVFDSIDYHCTSAHYYRTDEDAVKKIIGE